MLRGRFSGPSDAASGAVVTPGCLGDLFHEIVDEAKVVAGFGVGEHEAEEEAGLVDDAK
ncbi:hypothetical protein [Nannocystis pusilla]|uniref:hypothetical protein n=1 Tax=Nannocystis pusilla TaxID=889268 RepID=UPI003B7FA387